MDELTPPPRPKSSRPSDGRRLARIFLVILSPVLILLILFLLPEPIQRPIAYAIGYAAGKTEKFFKKSQENQSDDDAGASTSNDAQSQDRSIPDDDTRTISGTVLSVTDDGVLVEQGGAEYFVNGMRTSTPSSVFFIRGRFDYVDGDRVKLNVLPAGTYRYTTAMGSRATVRAYKVRK